MNSYYEQLLNFKGAEELKEVIDKWEVLSLNIEKHPLDSPIVLPDLFLYTHSGYGNTRLISLLSEYLNSKGNLMSFYGDVRFIEFKLYYCKPDSEFDEMYRFIDTIKVAAGFRNEFKGVVRVNLNDWIGHHKDKYFLEFLNYLNDNTKNWLVILSLSDAEDKEDAKAMEGIVSMYLRIETVELKMPSDIDFVEYAGVFLTKYGFELSQDAKDVLVKSIEVLRRNKYFNGYHTVSDLCNDIVYSIFSKSTDTNRVITADMISEFSADSEYIERTVIKDKQRITLGF
ncbi:MAG: hypothetical protein IKB72_05030 [Ruminococcus sp.]|nr:hypothetical protein [Ruminococcus sp.]